MTLPLERSSPTEQSPSTWPPLSIPTTRPASGSTRMGTRSPGAAGRPAWVRSYVHAVVAVDFLLAAAAAGLALLVRFEGNGGWPYLVLTLLFPVVWVLAAAATRAYESRFFGTGSEEYRRVFDAGVRYSALVATVSFALGSDLSRGFVVIAFPAAMVFVLTGRYAVRQALQALQARGRCQHHVVAVGTERSVAELIRKFARGGQNSFRVVGACVDSSRLPVIEGVPVIGTSKTVVQALRSIGADTVAIGAWSAFSQDDLRRLSWQLEGTGVDVVVAPSITDIAGPRIHIRPVAGLPLLHVEEPEFAGARRVIKGLFDRTLALLALILLAPLLVTVALAVRLDSPGPALFRQRRVGRNGTTFTMVKFRSMRQTAEAELDSLADDNELADSVLFKIRADPRVTSVGHWLRRFSLDELPQLLNVLAGQMSLVGPRPPLPGEVDRYPRDAHRRLLVKPGVTGLWQISGRSDLSWDESVRLDLHYVENWSLAIDLMILSRTVFAVLARRGAY